MTGNVTVATMEPSETKRDRATTIANAAAARRKPDAVGAVSRVFAGTINGHGALTVRVTRRRPDTTLARIVHLVEAAQAKRAPMQQFIDHFAAWYTPAIVVLAAAVAAVPWIVPGQDTGAWVYRALVLVVVSCPCALVISTPVTVVAALTSAARRGVFQFGHVTRVHRDDNPKDFAFLAKVQIIGTLIFFAVYCYVLYSRFAADFGWIGR